LVRFRYTMVMIRRFYGTAAVFAFLFGEVVMAPRPLETRAARNKKAKPVECRSTTKIRSLAVPKPGRRGSYHGPWQSTAKPTIQKSGAEI
jgi:hypothetical protein